MSDKFKNSKFYKTMKNPKVSRAIYISLVLVLIAAAVTVGIVSAAKRSNPKTPSVDTAANTGSQNRPSTAPSDTTAKLPETDETPTESTNNPTNTGTSAPTAGKVPALSLPVSGKLTKYHDAKVQVFSETMQDYRVHLGVDIATSAASPVYAAAAGKVNKIWKDPLMGYCVAITHSGDSVTVYKNLSDTLPDGIAEGVSVKVGQQIGSVGESAMLEIAEEPHLHLEMTVGGIQVDPLEYFSKSDLDALSADTGYED